MIAILRTFHQQKKCFENFTPTTDPKLVEKKLDEKVITLKFVNDGIRQDPQDKTNVKEFSLNIELNQENAEQEIVKCNGRENTQGKSFFFCGTPNWITEHISPSKQGNCNKCGKKATWKKEAKPNNQNE